MLDKLESAKISLLEDNKDKFKEIREEYREHIEHISMQLEDFAVQCKLRF